MIKYHFRKNYYINFNNHDQFLTNLPKISQKIQLFKILYSPKEFNNVLLNTIYQAQDRICLITLNLENDQGGKTIIDAILYVKKLRPNITVRIIVDLYRSQRDRIGTITHDTNFNWYHEIIQKHPNTEILIYGIPININEVLGVLHLKGFIIDDKVLYSGASINNEYLHINNKYRHDRYHIIQNKQLSNTMFKYITQELLTSTAVYKYKLGYKNLLNKKVIKNKNKILLFRKRLRKIQYDYQGDSKFNGFSVTPLVGLGKNSIVNQTIYHLVSSVKNKIILCTPYFNMTKIFIYNLIYLLRSGKIIEIIVGDKTANDFYNFAQEHESFKLIDILPYLYEINLRNFIQQLQKYVDSKQLIIRLWKEGNNGYHIKGIWVDNEWQLITGSNLNLRSFKYDLENALLVHDPFFELICQSNEELNKIRLYTKPIQHYSSIQKISDYPTRTKQLIKRICKIKFDRLIKRLL